MRIDNAGVACEARARCANCGGAGDLLYTGLSDTLFGAPGLWSLRRCRCGLAWLDPQPLPDQIGRFYQSYWTHAAADDVPAAAPPRGLRRLAKAVLAVLVFWRRAAFENQLNHLHRLPPGRVLDVGCGDGRFLSAAAAAGWEAVGVDFDARASARSRPGVQVHLGDLFDCAFPAAAFDAVVLDNVIEHLPDPGAVFAECARLLRPGGRLVMITPNLDALGHAALGRDWRGLEPPRHLFLFTARTLRRFARRAGFARTAVCTSTGQTAPDWPMLRASLDAARAAGRPAAVDLRKLKWKERLLDLAGLSRGEWVTLVARR
jgi:SAM-dependent methyltransferase